MGKFDLLDEIESSDNDEDNAIITTDYNELTTLSIAQEKKIKDALAHTKKVMSLQLDGRKLRQAEMLYDSIEQNLSIISDREVFNRVKENIKKAEDFKFIMEAVDRQYKMLQNLLRLDSVDGQGTSARIAVAVDFGNGAGFNFGFNKD